MEVYAGFLYALYVPSEHENMRCENPSRRVNVVSYMYHLAGKYDVLGQLFLSLFTAEIPSAWWISSPSYKGLSCLKRVIYRGNSHFARATHEERTEANRMRRDYIMGYSTF